MKILREGFSLDEFFSQLAESPQSLLLLDYDGTLSPFVVERDEAVPYEGVRERIEAILDSARTRLVLISGREVKQVRSLLDLEPAPEIFGCHGAERYHPRTGIFLTGIGEAAQSTLHEIHDWAKHEGLTDRAETKPTSIAFHVRGMAKEKASHLLAIVRGEWQDYIEGKELILVEFDGGVEIRAIGVTKGDAVKTLMEETSQTAAVAYLGDDRTDEDAFAVLGERGIKVLVRPQLRESQADIWISPPEELLEFLDRWNKAQG